MVNDWFSLVTVLLFILGYKTNEEDMSVINDCKPD